MSLPQRPPLPKPPPKAPPPGRPGMMPPPAAPAMAAPAAPSAPRPPVQATAPVSPAAPAVPQPVAAAAPQPAAAPRAPIPTIEIRGLSPSMAAMMEAIRIYEDLLVEENTALRSGDSKTVAALLDRKMGATRLYQDRLRTVLGDGETTRSLTPEQRAQVVSMVRSLEELAKENTLLLKANMGAIEQLFEVINTAARKMRKREVAYSQAGVIRDFHQASNTSLAYNHTV